MAAMDFTDFGAIAGNLRQVNSSQPQLVHSASQRSITASDDYYSASDAASHAGSHAASHADSSNASDDRTTVIRHHTPVDRFHTPVEWAGASTGGDKRSAGSLAAGEYKRSPAPPLPAHPEVDTPRPQRDSLEEARPVRLPTAATAAPAETGAPARHVVQGKLQWPLVQPAQPADAMNDSTDENYSPVTPHPSLVPAPLAVTGHGIIAPHADEDRAAPAPAYRPVASPLPEAPGAYPHGSTTALVEEPALHASTVRAIEPTTEEASAPRAIEPTTQDASAVRFTEPPSNTIPRKAVRSADVSHWHGATSQASPTPGVDDTPYIHFAIDQLTRDEELLGRSRDARGSPDIAPVGAAGAGYSAPGAAAAGAGYPAPDTTAAGARYPAPSTTAAGARYPAAGTTTAGARYPAPGTTTAGARDSPDPAPVRSHGIGATAAGLTAAGATAAVAHEVSPMTSDDEFPQRAPREVGASLHHPQRPIPAADPVRRSLSVSPLSEPETAERRVAPLAPREPPPDNFMYPPLTFIPASLRLPALFLVVLTCIVFIALLTASVVWASKRGGLWLYDGIGTSRYFLAEYLPQLLAVLFVIYVQVVQTALQRILPYVLLSRKPAGSTRDIFFTVPIVITNYLLPNRSLFQPGELTFAYVAISFWLNLFTVPLATALYQTRLYSAATGVWKWTTVQPVGIVLIGLYLNLAIALLALNLRLRRHNTGLKWDPTSLADIAVLIRKSGDAPPAGGRESFPSHRYSLGYWESPSQPGEFFHGLGAAPSAPRLEIARGKAVPQTKRQSRGPAPASTFESWKSYPSMRLRPWYLRESPLGLFAVIAVVLMVAFLVASYLRAALGYGFNPLVATATAATASFTSFSPANFVFSFVPALLGLLGPLLWAPLDTTTRVFAPFVALAGGGSVRVQHSLLLSYAADPPGVATVRAALHRDYAIAGASALALLNWALPILGGGLFTAQFVRAGGPAAGTIVMRADPGGLGALTAVVVLCALGWVAAWPVTGRMLRGGWFAARRPRRRRLDAEKARPDTGASAPATADERTTAPPTGRGCAEDWLCGTDVRYLGGIAHAVGGLLHWKEFREPRSRAILTGRVMAHRPSRVSWTAAAPAEAEGMPGQGRGQGVGREAGLEYAGREEV